MSGYFKPKPAPIKHQNGYRIHFSYKGKQYRHYAGKNEQIANLLQSRLNNLITEFKYGLIVLPQNISLRDFIFSQIIQKPEEKITEQETILTLKQLMTYYRENTHKAPQTMYLEKTHLKHLNNFIKHKGYDPYLKTIKTGFFEEYKTFRKKQGVVNETINKELGTFQVMFKQAVKHEYIEKNIVRSVERGKRQIVKRFRTTQEIQTILNNNHSYAPEEIKRIKRYRFLSKLEIKELISLFKESYGENHWIIPVLMTFAHTGLRRGELLNLSWTDIHFKEGILITKSRKQSQQKEVEERNIYIAPELKEVLQKQKEKTGHTPWVFIGVDGNKLKKETLRKNFIKVIRGTKFEGIGFHAFRHSLTSILAQKGEDAWIIARILGHKTYAMHEHYKHLFPGRIKQAMENISYLNL